MSRNPNRQHDDDDDMMMMIILYECIMIL